jgi:hypothetical protein
MLWNICHHARMIGCLLCWTCSCEVMVDALNSQLEEDLLCVSGANHGSPVSAMVSEEAQQLLHDATELDYLTHIIIRMYENKR